MPTEPLEFNNDLEICVLTDKDKTKEVPCRSCKRRCVVTMFASASKTSCNTCRKTITPAGDRFVKKVVPDPYTPDIDLKTCVRTAVFKEISCPFDPTGVDPLHNMEIKSIVHSNHGGPGERPGETVMFQCSNEKCMCVVQMSSNHKVDYKPMNESRHSDKESPYVVLRGERKAA